MNQSPNLSFNSVNKLTCENLFFFQQPFLNPNRMPLSPFIFTYSRSYRRHCQKLCPIHREESTKLLLLSRGCGLIWRENQSRWRSVFNLIYNFIYIFMANHYFKYCSHVKIWCQNIFTTLVKLVREKITFNNKKTSAWTQM